jgi:hypothetical protein
VAEDGARGELRFVVDARHIQQLGRELVENQVTAVTELIKNAYDADATTVVVQGFGSHRRDGVLVVVDDGSGMQLQDVELGWMRLSSDGKERNPRSAVFKRHRAGRKGIGRFSTQSLASDLSLWTTRANEPVRLVVDFHWDQDYRAGRDLGDVTNAYHYVPGPPRDSGTALVMRGLHEVWTEREWNRVRDAAMLLQPPFGQSSARTSEDPGFRVVILPPAPLLDLPESPFALSRQAAAADDLQSFGLGASAVVLADFLSAATATLVGTVDADGVAEWSVTSDRLKLADSTVSERRYAAAGPFSFKIAYFIYRRDVIGDVKVRVASRMGQE